MPTIQLTDKLLCMSLFQGMSRSDLHEIVGHTKFGFEKFAEGKVIVKADDACHRLLFLLSGTMEATTYSADKSFCVQEVLTGPYQLQPERLFGIRQQYSTTFKAGTLCHFISLSKSEVINLINNYEIFRINLINILAAGYQKTSARQWMTERGDLRTRLVKFFISHTIYPAGEKHFKIKMEDIAAELNETRLTISKELNRLQDEKIITLTRGQIHIYALEQLFK